MNIVDLMRAGRNGDTLIAHISPKEGAILRSMGGSGTVNPKTGLLEFWGGDTGESGMGTGESVGADESGMGTSDYGTSDYGTNDYGSFADSMDAATAAAVASAMDNGTLSDLSDYTDAAMNPGVGVDTTDTDVGKGMQNQLSWAENLGLSLEAVKDNFMDDPLGYTVNALTPSPETLGRTVGGVLGFLSPAPFGTLAGSKLGSWIGSQYAAGNMSTLDPGFSFSGESGTGGAGADLSGQTGYAAAPSAISSSATASKSFMYPLAQKQYPWSYNADRGTGGGLLARLMR